MTWLEHHRLSERHASDAAVARLRGEYARAKELSAIAAQHEARALDEVAPDKPRTYGITAVSAVALHFKAAEFPEAKDLAYRCLASRRLPEFASQQIEDLLQSIHRESAKMQRGFLDYPDSQPARLTFGGKPVIGQYGIVADFSAKALAAFEKAVASVGASQDGHLRWKGPIPNRDAYNLLITGIAHGSFGFEFEGASSGRMNVPQPSKAEAAVETVKKVLQASVESSDDHELVDLLGDLNRRAIKDVWQFLEVVAKNEAFCALEFGDDGIRFDNPDQVRRSMERLGRIEKEEIVELTGEFVGFLPYRSRIEFLLYDSREVISAVARRAVVEFAEQNLNIPVTFAARKRQIGTAKPQYTFLDIRGW